MYDLREKYLRKKGKARPPFHGTSPFRNLREAGMANDFEAFKDARKVYLASGKGYENFVKSLNFLDPIASRLSDEDERKFEHEFLNDLQLRKLKVARDYAQRLRVRLWHMWNDAAKHDTPGMVEELRAAQEREIISKARVMAAPIPALKSKKAEWRKRVDKARAWMEERGVDVAEARRVYWGYLKRNVKTEKARRLGMARFRRQVGKLGV